MRILQVSTRDIGGGAERVAWTLHHAYRQAGHEARLAVGKKVSADPSIEEIPNQVLREQAPWSGFFLRASQHIGRFKVRGAWRAGRVLEGLAEPRRSWGRWRGHEDFYHPASRHLLRAQGADVLHAHNLHGNYFDLTTLADYSQRLPVFLTLHDMWLLTGHCGHSLDCQRWQIGCGHCPDLSLYPPLPRDGTAYNWRRKRDIYRGGRFYVATPSRWLMDKVEASMLAGGALEKRVIPYGIDLSIFQPAPQASARQKLGLPLEAHLLLFSGWAGRTNPYKDYATMREAVRQVAQTPRPRPLFFLALGDSAPDEQLGEHTFLRHIPYQSDLAQVATYYQAADLYLHAARADNFPNAVLEALACGTPVVASAVGGIPEQVSPDTGRLSPVGDSVAMAEAIRGLLADEALRQQLGRQAAADAARRFDLKRQATDYLAWYQEALDTWHGR